MVTVITKSISSIEIPLSAIAFFAAAIKYSYDYRDFSAMKSIYLFPGLISYLKLFCDGINSFYEKKVYKIISVVLIAMIILSIWDELFLVQQLYKIISH